MTKKSKIRQSGPGGCLIAGFFGLFALAGGIAFYFLTWLPIANILDAKSWAPAQCVIVSSRVAENHSSDGSTYAVEITYTYEVDWQTYQGDRYDFSTGSSSGYAAKAEIVEAHPPGTEVDCYVDPEDPTRSVINRSPGGYLWWGLFPLPFLAVGLGGLAFFLVFKQREAKAGPRRDASGVRARAFAGTGQTVAATGAAERRHGPLELEAGQTPVAQLIAVIAFATLWNVVVGIFVFFVILPSFERGDPEWLVTVFMVPFVLIGLATIGGVVYQFLALFNPRPRLTLTDGHLIPGSEVTLSWQLEGRVGRLRSLTLELEGQEAARYRSGKNTHTDHHVFYTSPVVSRGPLDGKYYGAQRGGQTTLSIPQGTMPSFEAGNNRIEWHLKVHGDVPFWPDVNQSFPITVFPPEP